MESHSLVHMLTKDLHRISFSCHVLIKDLRSLTFGFDVRSREIFVMFLSQPSILIKISPRMIGEKFVYDHTHISIHDKKNAHTQTNDWK